MLSVTIATTVTVGLSFPKDGSVLAKRIDSQAINNSMALTILCAVSVSNMGRRLHVRNHKVRALCTQVSILQRFLKDYKWKQRELKQENKRLKKLVDSYANDLVERSIELDRTTTKLQEQYGRLLVVVKGLTSCPNS